MLSRYKAYSGQGVGRWQAGRFLAARHMAWQAAGGRLVPGGRHGKGVATLVGWVA